MRRRLAALATLLLTATAGASPAQTLDPIRCWWQTSAGAIRVGETFSATLTCAVREQEATRSVPDESRLAAAVVQMAPFEVLGGSHPEDLRGPTHRFFQYQYELRIVDRDVIGRDARLPALQIPYRVHTLVNGEWQAGRDRSYVIPSHSLRVLSLVPLDAADIRDSEDARFDGVTSQRTRARTLQVAAYALAALSLIVAVPAAASLLRRRRREAAGPGTPSPRALRRAIRAELQSVSAESTRGWTDDLTVRALRAMRVGATAALGQPPAVRAAHARTAETALFVTRGLWPRTTVALSAATTAQDVRRAAGATSAARQQALHELADAIAAFDARVYGRATTSAPDPDEGFRQARAALDRLLLS